jgi:hypothetical protein
VETVLHLLPAAVQQSPEYEAWNQHCLNAIRATASSGRDVPLGLLLHCFGDVHALVTSSERLMAFAFMPLTAVKLWAASDDLVVDCEDSVAVVLEFWVGKRIVIQQEVSELSGLVRLNQLTAGEKPGLAVKQWCPPDVLLQLQK